MAIFSDGFESGDFSAWTAASLTPTIVTSPVHHGTYAAQINANETYVSKTLAASYGTIYHRAYIRWTTNPAASGRYHLMWAGFGSATNTNWLLSIYNDAGTIKWELFGGGAYTLFATPNPTVNTWYCVEVTHIQNTANGNSLYVDGSLVGSISGTSDDAAIHYVEVGTYSGMPSGGASYYDCVVVADAYIGPEAAGVTVKKGSNLAATMTEMLNSKMLFSACNRFPKLTTRRF
jgi:hypothetical protein